MARVNRGYRSRASAVVLAGLGVCCRVELDPAPEHQGAGSGGEAGASVEVGGAGMNHGQAGAGTNSAGSGGSGRQTSNTAGRGGSAALEELAVGQADLSAVAVDDRYVFWLSGNTLRRAPLTGGDAVIISLGGELRHLVAASGYVYFTDRTAGTVVRVKREGGSIETHAAGTNVGAIAVRGDHVYWTNGGTTVGTLSDGSVSRAAFDGSGITVLTDGLSQPSGVAVDDEFAYFTSTARHCSGSSEGENGCFGGGVSKVPLEGGTSIAIDDQDTPLAIVLGESAVYWLVQSPVRVKVARVGDGDVRTVAELSGEGDGPFAVDDTAFYLGSSSRGRIVKVPFDGTPPLPIAVDLGEIAGVATDADWVYVAAVRDGRIVRVKKDGSATQPSGPIAGPCPSPLGSAEEIAATPRADQSLENLALLLDEGEVTARQETYDRVTADVARIRALEPGLADVTHFPTADAKTLLLTVSDTAMSAIQSGDYTAWNCLNAFYGLTSLQVTELSYQNFVVLELKGNYALDVLAPLYAELPGIEAAEPNGFGGDGPTICAWRDGEEYEYVIDRASGDCPAGCIRHDAHHFRSAADGALETLESWNSETDPDRPDWYERICRR